MDIEAIKKELRAYEDRRDEFYRYLDEHIPHDGSTGLYDFRNKVMLDAEKVYELFHKLDYQARKIRGIVINEIVQKSDD
ncbi:MAG: hypothetical protein B6D59_07210 [Campylobacteraceae bacterium 4484_4]|jgi:hypothetical protein|uniref:hypothetical protein n=1 Tax=Hydrogenimonas sp. TaxID=2231112 RepID=UPI000A0B0708|nr:hypothetical protein [Hydrogenimonas sp.]OQX72872.1 MAG: hypothetical protein B6D59_07210 [Campylobacteraceae bacterium 4484_4]